ncbi:MAG TPA: phosphoenolpyruvate synthase [archaeon]|nr:phosphoenolpyruvate synthase [archaeon]
MIAKTEKMILWFDELRKDDIPLVGGKNANLGEMISAGIPVPPGFAITAYTYQQFITTTGIAERIYKIINDNVKDINDPKEYELASEQIRKLIETTAMPADTIAAIKDSYKKLNKQIGSSRVFVAVRSSATAEDLPDASFAGQQETFLNVSGDEELLKSVQKCWSSLFTPRAIFYRTEKGFRHENVLISVGVQKMVNAKAAGVMFTLHPVTGDTSKIIIEATWGLGESLVSGAVTPDRYTIDKNTLKILDKEIANKTIAYLKDQKTGKTIHVNLPREKQASSSLTDEEIIRLSELAKKIEDHYQKAQDIEFSIDNDLPFPDSIFIVQSRPETVWSAKMVKPQIEASKAAAVTNSRVIVLKGLPASPGVYAGPAKVTFTTKEADRMMKNGDVLVTKMTNPDWAPFMKMAGAIVTDEGGMTCHAAIVSREMGIPCIVGTKEATKVLITGENYTVDAKAGIIYKGIIESVVKPEAAAPAMLVSNVTYIPTTATKIYVNLSIPEIAEKVFKENQPDGVGLLRAEHMLLSIGKHPRKLIQEGGGDKMIDAFAEGIRKVAEAFYPRPVVYRFLDFKPDEFLGLEGGEIERELGHVGPNPLIGYRGAFRYRKEPEIFRLECRAINKVREDFGLKNVVGMIPFVRTLADVVETKKIMEGENLKRSRDFKLWIMVEVPNAVFLIDKFIETGIDGISFGTNDLTMLILGIDRDDASIAEIYDERDPGILRALARTIKTCKEHGVTTSICGQAPSVYPEYCEFLVRQGATSMSVNPDTVIATRKLVASIEQKILLECVLSDREKETE